MRPRALIVAASGSGVSGAELRHIAAESEMCIGVDAGAAVLLAAGLVPDVVVGDLDSLTADARGELLARGVPIHAYDIDKDETDLDLALAWCRDAGAAEIVASHVWGGRLDHSLAVIGSLATVADLCPVIVTPGETAWVLGDVGRTRISGFAPGATLSILAISAPATASVTGVTWPLHRHTLKPLSSHGVSNRVLAEGAEVVVHEGVILVAVCKENGRPE